MRNAQQFFAFYIDNHSFFHCWQREKKTGKISPFCSNRHKQWRSCMQDSTPGMDPRLCWGIDTFSALHQKISDYNSHIFSISLRTSLCYEHSPLLTTFQLYKQNHGPHGRKRLFLRLERPSRKGEQEKKETNGIDSPLQQLPEWYRSGWLSDHWWDPAQKKSFEKSNL